MPKKVVLEGYPVFYCDDGLAIKSELYVRDSSTESDAQHWRELEGIEDAIKAVGGDVYNGTAIMLGGCHAPEHPKKIRMTIELVGESTGVPAHEDWRQGLEAVVKEIEE